MTLVAVREWVLWAHVYLTLGLAVACVWLAVRKGRK